VRKATEEVSICVVCMVIRNSEHVCHITNTVFGQQKK